MVKHILTTKCPRKCDYCIMKNARMNENSLDEFDYFNMLMHRYTTLKGANAIMLTGGEPTSFKLFLLAAVMAKVYFPAVYLTSQNPDVCTHSAYQIFDAVTYSLHKDFPYNLEVSNHATVYASILAERYFDDLPEELKQGGFSGLTINENYFGKEIFDETCLPTIEGFSIKINRRGKCINDGTKYILPDLTIKDSFEEYLK